MSGSRTEQRLLRRMQLVAAVGPVDDIADGRLRKLRIALRQQVGAFVLIAEILFRRRVALRKDEVTDDAETRLAPCLHEAVGMRPAVEADSEAVAAKNAEHLRESWLEPGVVVVVRDGAPVARNVARDIRRVRQDEIDAVRRKLRENAEAVALDDRVAEFLNCVCHDVPLFRFAGPFGGDERGAVADATERGCHRILG